MRKHPNATSYHSQDEKYNDITAKIHPVQQDHCKEQTENRSQQNADIAKTIPIVHDGNLHHG